MFACSLSCNVQLGHIASALIIKLGVLQVGNIGGLTVRPDLLVVGSKVLFAHLASDMKPGHTELH